MIASKPGAKPFMKGNSMLLAHAGEKLKVSIYEIGQRVDEIKALKRTALNEPETPISGLCAFWSDLERALIRHKDKPTFMLGQFFVLLSRCNL
jgi:hypothetical protein